MERNEIINKIQTAYMQLLARDRHLLNADANERSITHKLAEYLQLEFKEWDVDCEYNRDGIDTKRLHSLERSINSNDTVFPDIIVHHRGENENLIVIEAKKSNYSGKNEDDKKLKAFKKDLGYKYAFKVTFPLGEKMMNVDDASNYIEEV